MLWVKAFHIIFMVTWLSGLFYLPRLFVYHAMAKDEISIARFKIMERKLFFGIMTPGAVFTIIFGVWLLILMPAYIHMQWLHWKLTLVLLLIAYHCYLWKQLYNFKYDRNVHEHVFFKVINEIPVLLLAAIVILVVVQPFGYV